jgi:hypothetical protein
MNSRTTASSSLKRPRVLGTFRSFALRTFCLFEKLGRRVAIAIERNEGGILRRCQQESLLNLRDKLLRYGHPGEGAGGPFPHVGLVWMPAGTGKSAVIALAPYVLMARRVLIIQTSKEISNFKTASSLAIGFADSILEDILI